MSSSSPFSRSRKRPPCCPESAWFSPAGRSPGQARPWLRSPTVGDLLDLLEENYHLLLCLAPDLRHLSGALRAAGKGADLYLDVLEQAPYTTLVRLTYRFALPTPDAVVDSRILADPDVRLRVCHDARQAEVIALRQTALPLLNDERLATLKSKWNANWFLSKWLGYCVRENRRFFRGHSSAVAPLTAITDSVSTV